MTYPNSQPAPTCAATPTGRPVAPTRRADAEMRMALLRLDRRVLAGVAVRMKQEVYAIPDRPHADTPTGLIYTGDGSQLFYLQEYLLQLFSMIIDLDVTDSPYPRWTDSTTQLMELAWELWRLRRIVDYDTGRPITLRCLAGLMCRKLHCTLPRNVSATVRQSKRSNRLPVLDY